MRLPTFLVLQADGMTLKNTPQRFAVPHIERFTTELCGKPDLLAASLTRLMKSAYDIGIATYASPFGQAITFRGLTAGTSGAKLTVVHNFGRTVQWTVVGWRGASTTTGYQLVEDSLDTTPTTTTNALSLRSYTAGTVDLMVW